jgi:hypothetical protein
MQILRVVLVIYTILMPVISAKDYGCSDRHENEKMCGKYSIGSMNESTKKPQTDANLVAGHHRNLKQCFKGKWRVYTCPQGCKYLDLSFMENVRLTVMQVGQYP